MFLQEKLNIAGEHPFFFSTSVGEMEALVLVPKIRKPGYLALLGHPHSLHGGTMQNKVVTTLARAFQECGIASIRFNFRGVGRSQGVFDAGIGESKDMLQLIALCQQLEPKTQFFLAGFSFGSYVTYRVAAEIDAVQLISVGPPVTHFDFHEYASISTDWHIIQGTQDEVIAESSVHAFVHSFDPPLPYHLIDTSHFFHGKLVVLKNTIMELISH